LQKLYTTTREMKMSHVNNTAVMSWQKMD